MMSIGLMVLLEAMIQRQARSKTHYARLRQVLHQAKLAQAGRSHVVKTQGWVTFSANKAHISVIKHDICFHILSQDCKVVIMLYDILQNLMFFGCVQRTNPKQRILSNKRPQLTELVEDDLWLESNTGKQSCAQTQSGTTKGIETERGNRKLPLMHGKPALSHLNRQASISSITAPKSKNKRDVSNDEMGVVLLHKQAKKQPSNSEVCAHAQDVQEADGAATSQLISKTREPNTSSMERNTTRWSLGTSNRASSQASAGANHDTTVIGQRDGSSINHKEAKNLDGNANALIAPSQELLKQRKATSRGGLHHVAASKAHQLLAATQFLREPLTLGEDSLESAPSGISSSSVPVSTSSQSGVRPKQGMAEEANRQEFEVANIVKQGVKHFAQDDMR